MAKEIADTPGGADAGPRPARPGLPTGIVLEYRLEEPVSLVDAPAFPHIERWTVSVLVDQSNGEDERRHIGYARVVVLNLDAGVTLADLADTATGEWTEIAGTVEARIEPGAGGARGEDSEPAEARYLVLERLWIEPGFRGNGLGPVTACYAILRLGHGCRLAACYPAPFEASRSAEDRDRSIAALGRIWAKVGFTPWNDGVWTLDLHTTDMRDRLEGLLPHTHAEHPQDS
jgi:GNAT superfamily N-acetyltransferase